jgi:hypothetical protein
MPRRFRLIILGAGFSRPAGFPLAPELWKEIRDTAASFSPGLRAPKFIDDLDDYIAFRRETEGVILTPETVDFEDFMRFLDVEHYLGLRGSDTWSEDGNEGTVVTKFLIGKILARHTVALTKVPELYVEFATRLEPGDVVITSTMTPYLSVPSMPWGSLIASSPFATRASTNSVVLSMTAAMR